MKTNPYATPSPNCVQHFGFELRMALRNKKMSCAELADYLGKSRSTVRKWLYMNEPTLDHMRLLIPILGVEFFNKIMPWLNAPMSEMTPALPTVGGSPRDREHISRLESRIQELERSLEVVLKKALNRA